jgi:hypothetical protein
MAEIIKTWPAVKERDTVLRVFRHEWGGPYYFTLGRGKPQQEIARLWMTHQGVILGSFKVREIVQNNGANIPRLRSLSNRESEWQIKADAWVAICEPPCEFLADEVFHEGFRGWRYFSLAEYRESDAAKVYV